MSSARNLGVLAALVLGLGGLGFVLGNQISPRQSAPPNVAPPLPATPARVHDGPNVLIVLWDTVRADRLSLYGYDKPTTPNLEAFAANARVYERAVSPGIWTPPSHGSMFTGVPPSQHGVKATYKWLDQHHVTLAEVLTEHGYDSYAFSANPFVSLTTNLLQGFQRVDHSFEGEWKRSARRATVNKLIPNDASTDISPKWKPTKGQRAMGTSHAYKDAGTVADDAFFEWLETRAHPDRPFVAYLNYMEAHIPRVPSMASRKKVMSPEQIGLSLKTDVAQINLLSYTFGKVDYSEEELEAINGVYDAALIDLDLATQELFAGLEARGLLDNTIVVLTSDHGENLGDHHMFGHKYSVWDTLLHVPLVVHFPPKVEAGRVDTAVSNLDLFATLFDLVGLEKPSTAPLSRSLMNTPTREDVFSEMIEATPTAIQRVDNLYGIDNIDQWLTTYRVIERDRRKLVIGSDGSQRLYDLRSDPQERAPLPAPSQAELDALLQSLDHWHDSFPVYDPANRTEADAQTDEPPDEKTLSMLEQLGYLTGLGEDDGPPAKGHGGDKDTPADGDAPASDDKDGDGKSGGKRRRGKGKRGK